MDDIDRKRFEVEQYVRLAEAECQFRHVFLVDRHAERHYRPEGSTRLSPSDICGDPIYAAETARNAQQARAPHTAYVHPGGDGA